MNSRTVLDFFCDVPYLEVSHKHLISRWTFLQAFHPCVLLIQCISILCTPPHTHTLPSERLRDRVVALVSKSYSSIRLGELCSLLGRSEEQVRHSEATTRSCTGDCTPCLCVVVHCVVVHCVVLHCVVVYLCCCCCCCVFVCCCATHANIWSCIYNGCDVQHDVRSRFPPTFNYVRTEIARAGGGSSSID